jgi:hypothetical protein
MRRIGEYRINDEESPLLLCCHSLVLSGCDQMRTKPVREIEPRFLVYSREASWMA